MDPRTINFNVLRRHDPRISSILDSTSYAVIYRYFHGAWSKTGFEGTLFIFQRDTHPFNGVFVLNRQGLDNLCEGLRAGWDVDLDEGLIIWRSAGATGEADDDVIYGIWVYEEKDRARIATAMQELINGVPTQQDLQPTPSPPPVSLSHPVPRVPIISAGQTISLDQLFGVGSVCSEPPPQTSALPHPGTSVIDSEEPPEEQQDNFLPDKILSPDASDLPKGMQLLDSLFQKAAIKSQNSHQSSTKIESINQHPQSIQQLMVQTSALSPQRSSHIGTTTTKPSTSKTRRDRHQVSNAEETYKSQSIGGNQTSHVNIRPTNPSHSSRPDYRTLNHSNNNSRRSSGGSSSRSRNDQFPIVNPNPQTQQHVQLLAHLNSSNTASLVAAPVLIENANAEARHNILSLLGHPAATRSDDVYTTQTANFPNSTLVSPPTEAGIIPPQESTDHRHHHHHHHGNKRMYHSEHHFHQPVGSEITPSTGSHAGSQAASQQASPNLNTQQTFIQHPPATPSHVSLANPSPPRSSHIQSATHSPNGPRPQMDPGHHHQQSPKNLSTGSPSSGQPMGTTASQTTGPVFSTSVWPFNKLTPNRALSPLNPARQSPSNFNQPTRGNAPGNYRQPHNDHHHPHRNLPVTQSQKKHLIGHSPPEINDSSRPIKPDSYGSSSHNNNNVGLVSPNINNHVKVVAVNPKLAVESLDELLILDNSCPKIHQAKTSCNDLNHLNQSDSAPLDKSQFVNGILKLINNNEPFVDTLYARYLARYAEKYL